MQGHTCMNCIRVSEWDTYTSAFKKNIYVFPCVCMWRPGVDITCFPWSCSTLFFDTGPSLSLELMNPERLAGHYAPGICRCLLQAWGCRDMLPHLTFYVGCGDLDSGSLLAQVITLLTEPLSRPCISVCAARLRRLPQAKACAQRPVCPAGLSRVTLPSGVTWHDSGFIPVKGDTISFLM